MLLLSSAPICTNGEPLKRHARWPNGQPSSTDDWSDGVLDRDDIPDGVRTRHYSHRLSGPQITSESGIACDIGFRSRVD